MFYFPVHSARLPFPATLRRWLSGLAGGLLIVAAVPVAQADPYEVTASRSTTAPTEEIVFSLTPFSTNTSKRAIVQRTTTGRQEVGQVFKATEDFRLDALTLMSSARPSAATVATGSTFTISIYEHGNYPTGLSMDQRLPPTALLAEFLVTFPSSNNASYDGGTYLTIDLSEAQLHLERDQYYGWNFRLNGVSASGTDEFYLREIDGTYADGTRYLYNGINYTGAFNDVGFYLQGEVEVIPEPSVAILALGSLAVLVMYRRCRKAFV